MRASVRYNLCYPAQLRLGPVRVSCCTSDLHAQGARLRMPGLVPPGLTQQRRQEQSPRCAQVMIRLGTGAEVEFDCHVAHVTGSDIGLHFLTPHRHAVTSLVSTLAG